MDERQDRQRPAPPARAKARRIAADGIIGRLTYSPAQGEERIGQVRRNRAKDESECYVVNPRAAHCWDVC